MYCGHAGIGIGAKGLRPKIPLWLLVVAAFGPDWWQTLLMPTGMSGPRTILLSHTIPAVALGSIIAGICAYFLLRRSWHDALIIAAVFVSHLAVDYLTGIKPTGLRPDGGPAFGLGLYQRPFVDFVLESAVILLGFALYRRSLRPEQARSPLAWVIPAGLIAMQAVFDRFFVGG